jgi:hypothetical protein
MRHLLLLLMLLLSPIARAQEFTIPTPEAGHANGGVEPAMVPIPRPALVVGEVVTPRFRLLYTARSEGSARQLANNIEAIRDGFVSVLGRDWPGVTEIRVGVGREEFEALALPGGAPPGWAVALAYPSHRIVLLNALTLAGPEGMVTLRHELAHVALGQIGRTWPRWFQEGLAQHLTGERIALTHYAAIFRAVTQERVFHFEDLAEDWPDMPADVEVAYAQSADFVAYLASRHGPGAMGQLLDGVAAGEGFEMAFGKAFHSSLMVEENAWREGLATRYGWLPLTTSMQLVWLVAPALCVIAYVRRRRQQAARLEAMAAEEAAEDAALQELAAEADQRGLPPSPPVNASFPEWVGAPPEDPRERLDDEDELGPRPPKPTLH